MAEEITLSVNGTKRVVSSALETPLLFVLRNELKLTGPRLGCGMAQCGACSVLLDREEVRSCITPVSYAVGKQVTTIEGLPSVWAAEKGLSEADAAKTLHKTIRGADQGRFHQHAAFATSMPLRYLRCHHRCGAACGQGHEGLRGVVP